MTTTTVKFNLGDIRVDGVAGVFSQTKQTSPFVHIHHCIMNANGIGCSKREFVASIPTGVYGSAAVGIKPRGNPQFAQMVEDAIQRYIDAGRAN